MSLRTHVVALSKLVRIGLHILYGLWIVYTRLPKQDSKQRQATIVRWSHELVRCFGIETEIKGQALSNQSALLMANHISWLDVEVLHATLFCRFVAKIEIQSWPIIGTLANSAQTIYIQRGNREHALNIVNQVRHALDEHEAPPIAIFPEGTTSDGTAILPFQRRLFQAALDANHAWVQPVAITYLHRDSRTLSTACSYIGEETLMTSIWRTLRSAPLVAVVEFCSPLLAKDFESTRTLSLACQEAVEKARQAYTSQKI